MHIHIYVYIHIYIYMHVCVLLRIKQMYARIEACARHSGRRRRAFLRTIGGRGTCIAERCTPALRIGARF